MRKIFFFGVLQLHLSHFFRTHTHLGENIKMRVQDIRVHFDLRVLLQNACLDRKMLFLQQIRLTRKEHQARRLWVNANIVAHTLGSERGYVFNK